MWETSLSTYDDTVCVQSQFIVLDSVLCLTSLCNTHTLTSINEGALLFSHFVSADTEPVEYRINAYRTFTDMKIDGELTEADWQKAQQIDRFIQFEPDAGTLMTQLTEVKVLYDDKYLYFGFICYEFLPRFQPNI